MKIVSTLSLLCLVASPSLRAQGAPPAAAPASRSAASARDVVSRVLSLQNVPNDQRTLSSLLDTIKSCLTPDVGHLDYMAERKVLLVHDVKAVVDAAARIIDFADPSRGHVLLDIQIVATTNAALHEHGISAGGRRFLDGVGTLSATERDAAFQLLRAHATIVQCPKLIAFDRQCATIAIGKKPEPVPAAAAPGKAGGARAKAMFGDAAPAPDYIELEATPTIVPGTKNVVVELTLRAPTFDVATLPKLLVAASGDTAVVRQLASPQNGFFMFVTPHIVTPAAEVLRGAPATPPPGR